MAKSKKGKKNGKNKAKNKKEKTSDGYSKVTLLHTSFLYQIKEFFANSTLHGIRYIAEQGRPFGEKFMWFVFVVIGAIAAFIIIMSLWEKFQTNPTITGLDTDFHNEQVIFPTVVVCPFEAFDETNVNFTAYTNLATYDPIWEQYEPFLQKLPSINYNTLQEFNDTLSNITDNYKKIMELNLRDYAFKVAITCNGLFFNESCKFRDEKINCCEVFRPVFSEQGFCYAFNTRYFSDQRQEIKNDQINNLAETDKKWALTFVLQKESKVFLFSSDETIGVDFRPQFIWEPSYTIDLLITMKQTYTTEDCESLSISQRKCIFPSEMTINYYLDDTYSFSACMKECRLKKTMRYCGCLPPFYSPAAGVPVPIKYCKVPDLSCLIKHRTNITSLSGCSHCELSCLNTVYDIEKFSKAINSDSTKQDDFRVNIEYLTWPIIRYKREVLFGWVDLLVSFGGIAGLFLGFSLLSGVEIIYYFTLRTACMVHKSRPDLVLIEEEKKKRPLPEYDLSLKPKFKASLRTTNTDNIPESDSVLVVQPKPETLHSIPEKGESPLLIRNDTEINSPVKIKSQISPSAITITNTGVEITNRFKRNETKGVFRLNGIVKSKIFHPISIAPYSSSIKPLDRKFNFNQKSNSDAIYDGYLP